jgi:hypothetical protein
LNTSYEGEELILESVYHTLYFNGLLSDLHPSMLILNTVSPTKPEVGVIEALPPTGGF